MYETNRKTTNVTGGKDITDTSYTNGKIYIYAGYTSP